MPYETHYVDMGKGIHKIGTGVVTSTEIFLSAIQLANDEEGNRKLKYCLTDFSAVTDLQITPDVIRQVIETNRKTAESTPGGIVAIVAPSPLAYGLSRLWQTFSEDLGWTTNVFHSRPAAIMWLRKQLGNGDDNSPLLNEFPALMITADRPED